MVDLSKIGMEPGPASEDSWLSLKLGFPFSKRGQLGLSVPPLVVAGLVSACSTPTRTSPPGSAAAGSRRMNGLFVLRHWRVETSCAVGLILLLWLLSPEAKSAWA